VTQKRQVEEPKGPRHATPAGTRDAGGGNGNGTEGRVREVIARVMNAQPAALGHEIRFVEDLHADSLRVMELVLELQEEFEIEIPDEALDKLRSVGDAIGFVKARRPG
jgi:acyl carrier protein